MDRCGRANGFFKPITAIVPRPSEHLKVATSSCIAARSWAPITFIGPQPLEHTEVTILSCVGACLCVPWTVLSPQPLEHLEFTMFSCDVACLCVPWTVLSHQPLEHLKVTISSCTEYSCFTPEFAVVEQFMIGAVRKTYRYCVGESFADCRHLIQVVDSHG